MTDYKALCAELLATLELTWEIKPRVIQDLLNRARTALAAEPEPVGKGAAVARLMYWNGKVGNFDATSPVARTYTELPQGEALYLDEGEPLYRCNQGNTKRQSAQEPVPAPEPGEVAECPHCGYEGEIPPAPQAGEVQP